MIAPIVLIIPYFFVILPYNTCVRILRVRRKEEVEC